MILPTILRTITIVITITMILEDKYNKNIHSVPIFGKLLLQRIKFLKEFIDPQDFVLIFLGNIIDDVIMDKNG